MSAGWASDAFFGKRRAPVCVIMMLGLAVVCAGMTFVPQGDWLAATAVLGLAGFMIYGPDMLMSGRGHRGSQPSESRPRSPRA